MRWIAKAAAFKILSGVPGGEVAYHFLQDHVLRTSRLTEPSLLHHIRLAERYLDALDGTDLARLHHVDLGAGWLPTVPVVFYSAGVERQTLFDVTRHMALPRVRRLVEAFRRLPDEWRELTLRWLRVPPDPEADTTLDAYLAQLGMRYAAPYTLEELQRQQADVVTCTGVLLHLREETIRTLLDAVAAGLREGGHFIAYVPLHDVYARFDPSISPYNKWRHSRFVWERVVDSRMMSFNRLTATDYHRLVEEAGLEIVHFETTPPSQKDAETLPRIKLHSEFAARASEEFLPSSLILVARR
jgi:SAM-dependent methyltransferase